MATPNDPWIPEKENQLQFVSPALFLGDEAVKEQPKQQSLADVLKMNPSGAATEIRTANPKILSSNPENTWNFGKILESALKELWSGFKTVLSSLSNSLNKITGGLLYGKYGGTVLLIAAAVGVGFLIHHLISGGSSPSADLASPTTTASPAFKDLAALHNQLGDAAQNIVSAGSDAAEVQTKMNQVELVYGSPIALAATPFAKDFTGSIYVTKSENPAGYASLENLDVPGYLHSLSQAKTRQGVPVNSAYVHQTQLVIKNK